MKTRLGFVSNSSCCSFIVRQEQITVQQLDKLYDWVRRMGTWTLIANCPVIFGYTTMDNDDIFAYMKRIGIPKKAILRFHSNDWDRTEVAWIDSARKELRDLCESERDL